MTRKITLEMHNYYIFSQAIEDEYPSVLYRYKHAKEFYTQKQLSNITGGVGVTKYFRLYLNDYIKNFSPKKIRDGKPYILELDGNGQFIVTEENSKEQSYMSETEILIYHYLCFIHIAEFWLKFEKIRNMNYKPKHLVIDDFLKRIDNTIDPGPYITLARKIESEAGCT